MLYGSDIAEFTYTDPQSARLLKFSRLDDGNIIRSGVLRKSSVLHWLADTPHPQCIGSLRLIFVTTDDALQPVLPFANRSEFDSAMESISLTDCIKPFMGLGRSNARIRSQGPRVVRVSSNVEGNESQSWVIRTHNCITTVMISYVAQTNTVSAFGIFKNEADMERLLGEIQLQRIHAFHPMLIPVLIAGERLDHLLSIYNSLFNDFRLLEVQAGMRGFSVSLDENFIAETYPVIRSSTDLKARSVDLISYLQSFRSCMLNPTAEGLEQIKRSLNLSVSVNGLSRQQLLVDDAGLHSYLELIGQDHTIAISHTESLATKMDSTLYAVCMKHFLKDTYVLHVPAKANKFLKLQTMLAQRDNKLNMQIAEDSRKLAYESKRNADLNLAIARQSMDIAEATKRDSSSMKAITFLTTVFLPGTFVATLLGTSMVEWTPNDFWRYWVITVPLTVGFLGIWVAYMMLIEVRGRRSIAKGEHNLHKRGSSNL